MSFEPETSGFEPDAPAGPMPAGAPDYLDRLFTAANEAHKTGNTALLANTNTAIATEMRRLAAENRAKVAEGMGPVEGAVSAFGEGARHAIRQAAGLFGLPKEDITESSQIDAPLFKKHPLAASLGSMGIAVPAMTGLAAALPGAAIAQIPATVAGSAAFADPGQRLKAGAVGALTGTVIPSAVKAAKFLSRGIQPEGAAKVLVDQGYGDLMTAGEYKPGGFLHRVEHAAETIPVAGPLMKARQQASLWIIPKRLESEMNLQPMIDDVRPQVAGASEPVPWVGGVPTSEGMHPWFKQALGRISNEYDAIKNAPVTRIPPAKPSMPALGAEAEESAFAGKAFQPPENAAITQPRVNAEIPADLSKLEGMTGRATEGLPLSATQERDVARKIQNSLFPLTKDSSWGTLHTVRSMLRQAKADVQSPFEKTAIERSENEITGQLETLLDPQSAQRLKSADNAYRNAMIVRDTLAETGLRNTMAIQPKHLRKALEGRLSDTSIVTGGGGPFREFVEAADTALSPPPLAEAYRALQSLGGGPFAMAALRTRALGLVGALSGAYTGTGQRILKGATAPQRLVKSLSAMAPEGSEEAARALATQYLTGGGRP